MSQLEEARALLAAPKVDTPVSAIQLPFTDASQRIVADDDVSDVESEATVDDPAAPALEPTPVVIGVLPSFVRPVSDVPATPALSPTATASPKSAKPAKQRTAEEQWEESAKPVKQRTAEEQLRLKKRAEAARAKRAEKKLQDKRLAERIAAASAPFTPPAKAAAVLPPAPKKKKRTASDALAGESRADELRRIVKKRFVGQIGTIDDAKSCMVLVNEAHVVGEVILALKQFRCQLTTKLAGELDKVN